jgi:hypothetical protein
VALQLLGDALSLRAASGLLVFAALAACGDDAPSENSEYPEPVHFSELKPPFPDGPACIANAAKKRQDTSAVTICRCNSCMELMQECEAVTGCTDIIACVNRSGCRDEFSCYLFPGAPCTATIDQWGNSSLATVIALDIMKCSTTNNCR